MADDEAEYLKDVFASFVQHDDVRVTKSRHNVNGIYLNARATDILEAYGIAAKYMPETIRKRMHGDFDFEGYSYSLDTRFMNRLSDEPGEKGWNIDTLNGALHLPLSEKGAAKHKALGATGTINPTPVDSTIDHVRMAMGPGGAIY